MNIAPSTVWWVMAGASVALELATGTFYLLLLGLGCAAGAIAALLGAGTAAQIAAAAVAGSGATALWRWRRSRQPVAAEAASNRDVNLDVGEYVQVTAWSADRTANVQYRGSVWMARLAPGEAATAGSHVVRAVEGNWLVLAPAERL
jgi:membrane protein implicated in regulation of membrane protease activity